MGRTVFPDITLSNQYAHGYTLNQISPSTPPVGSPVDTVTFAVAMEPRPRFVRAVPALARSDKLEALVILPPLADRKSVVEGKSVSVRVDLGGRRTIKKKKRTSLKRLENYTIKD